jgi:arylsulfatase A-like enzyme
MNKKRIIFFILLLLLLVASFFAWSNSNNPKNSRKNNVIIIVSDALRADVLGCYGGGLKTPHIDWLANNGVLFEGAHSTAPFTVPSAVSLLTGNYPTSYIRKTVPVVKWALPLVVENEILLAEIIKEMGYDVIMDVENKVALGQNNMQGFETIKLFNELTEKEKIYVENIINIKSEEDYCKKMYGFLSFLLNTTKEKKFFSLKWILDPHSPYDPPKKFRDEIKVNLSKLSRKKNYYSKLLFTEEGRNLSKYEQRYLKMLYEKEVESVDERVGFIVKALQHKDLLDSTYIIFTSDHGELFGEHGEWNHSNNFYEELLHIPLIITGPGIPQGKRIKKIVSLLDVIETLKDLLRIEFPYNSQGNSFKNLLSSNPIKYFLYSIKKNNFAYFDSASKRSKYHDALLENSYKLIVLRDNTYELYNLADDPRESNDISRENPQLVEGMIKKMEAIRQENRMRRENRMGTEEELKFDKEMEEKLKALGYIQ